MVGVWNRFRQNDEEAFSILFTTYVDTLYCYGRKFVADGDFVKDCIQDLFVKLHNNRASLSATTNPKCYLMLSLKNMIFDALDKTRRMTYVSPDDLPFLAAGYLANENHGEEDTETGQKMKAALDMLNPRQKEAIYLRFQLGLSYQEVSGLLSINYQSTRNLIHRSITRIRDVAEMSGVLVQNM